jgi:hypothetical protein
LISSLKKQPSAFFAKYGPQPKRYLYPEAKYFKYGITVGIQQSEAQRHLGDEDESKQGHENTIVDILQKG